MKILGIETSCDETAAAVIEGKRNKINVLSNVISSQINIHKKYGGVVPEVAAREHVAQILPVINETMQKAGIKRDSIALPPLARGGIRSRMTRKKRGLDAIAVTIGPGLITSLQVGVETAKVLSYTWNIPLIGINHIEGHIYANFITSRINREFKTNNKSNIKFPALILTVSGGHTMLVLMLGHGKYKTIGETRDDAAGEAFDKAAKLLNLGYPGGPIISEYADKFIKKHSKISNFQFPISNKIQGSKSQNSKKISLPRPMIGSNDFDFSFSGLKTALLYAIQKDPNYKKHIPEYCYEFQQAIIDVLIYKTIKAAQKYKVKNIMLSGGVSANKELRKQMAEAVKSQILPTCESGSQHSASRNRRDFQIPNSNLCTDNAVMIATAGYFHALRKDFTDWKKIRVDCNLELK